jgi:hypothetical protein
MPERARVVILDLANGILHLAGVEHLKTSCGQRIDEATVGPLRALVDRAALLCPACWEAVPVDGGQVQLWERP